MTYSKAARRAFSLLELLIVIGLAVGLMLWAIPAWRGVRERHGLTLATCQMVAALEMARNHAMTQQTYVWLGLLEDSGDVLLSVVASKDGTLWFNPDNAGFVFPGEQLVQVGKLIRIERSRLAFLDPGSGDGHTLETRPAVNPEQGRIGEKTAKHSFDYPLHGPRRYRFNKTLFFTPRGEAIVNTTYNLRNVVEVALQSAGDTVVVQMTGVSGQVSVYKK